MNSRTLTGLLLIVGPIVTFAGFIAIGAGLGFDVDWDDPSEMIPALGDNAQLMKTLFPVATLGMIIVAAGFSGLHRSMSDGSGAHYMSIGLLFFVIGTTVVVGESALSLGASEAASDVNQALPEALLAAAGAIGSIGEAIHFLGFAIIGIAIYAQKNLHSVLSILMFLIGLVGLGSALAAYTSPIMLLSYAGMSILTLATGVLVIRSKD